MSKVILYVYTQLPWYKMGNEVLELIELDQGQCLLKIKEETTWKSFKTLVLWVNQKISLFLILDRLVSEMWEKSINHLPWWLGVFNLFRVILDQ